MGGKLLCTSGRKVSPSVPKTDVLGLQNPLREKYGTWASNGSSVEEILNNVKEIASECIEILFHIKYSENPWALNTTARKLND
jgi:hypothetical protein